MLTALEPCRRLSYIDGVELPRNTVRILIALMAVALAGILFLQYRMLRSNLELKEESFGHNVMAALNDASNRLEEIDLRDRFFTSSADSGGPFVMRFYRLGPPEKAPGPDTMMFVSVMTSDEGSLTSKIRGNTLSYTTTMPESVAIRVYDELGRLDTTILQARVQAGTHTLPLPDDTSGRTLRFVQIRMGQATSTIRWDRRGGSGIRVDTDEETHTARIVGRVAESVGAGKTPPLAVRVRPGLLDSVIASGLTGNGITLPYDYALRDPGGDSIVYARMGAGGKVPKGRYATTIFPGGFGANAGELMVWFPGYGSHLFRSILPELLLNLLFVLVIGASFRYAIRTLHKQREFAGRLSDFINNMTHEFKTPLSTIALSTEALARPDISGDRSKIEMYGTIIADEQKRMKSQVDRILEMAALEEGEFEFRNETLDLHDIVSRAAANAELRVKEKGGSVTLDLRAQSSRVKGDGVHLANVVNSVLDNAEKYSPGAPRVRVSTYNADGWIVLTVADRGIGIAPEHLPNIFEKYYRVPTNNLHDVKGFGIGLCYVRLVVERHGGSVRATSTPGAGTTIEMKFRADDDR
jgi:signal transduction histidine kinase